MRYAYAGLAYVFFLALARMNVLRHNRRAKNDSIWFGQQSMVHAHETAPRAALLSIPTSLVLPLKPAFARIWRPHRQLSFSPPSSSRYYAFGAFRMR
jgi:hypothetical protein